MIVSRQDVRNISRKLAALTTICHQADTTSVDQIVNHIRTDRYDMVLFYKKVQGGAQCSHTAISAGDPDGMAA